MKKFALILALTNSLSCSLLLADHHQKQATRPATKADFTRYVKLEQGMWRAEVLSVISDNSLGNKQGKTTYYWHSVLQNSSCMTSHGSGGKNSIRGVTFYDPVEKAIIRTGVSSDGTISRSSHIPKGDQWHRDTVITKPDGVIVRLNSDVIHNDEKGITTIIIRGDGSKSSVGEQKNVWYRQHK
jgi:hypothetical protein